MQGKRATLRIATPPDADRAAHMAALSEECESVLRSVLAQEPIAVCIVYETATHVGYTAVPASNAVAIGLLNIASVMANGETLNE